MATSGPDSRPRSARRTSTRRAAIDARDALAAAAVAGLDAGPEACALLGVDAAALERRLSAG